LSTISTISISSEQSEIPQRLRIVSCLALAVVFAAVYFGSLFTPGLLDDADSSHAEAAREMFVTGDYVTLHINGVRYLEKAPLPYWLVATSYHVFGVNEFATRLPMALSVLLLGVLALVWARRAFGERAGTYAALFVYTAAGVFLFTRILIPDVLLSLLIAASLYFFLTALEDQDASWRWYAGYACMALGVLTKGLIALAFPGGAAFLYLIVTGEWRRWREFRLASGLALFLLIAAPWHLLAGLRNTGGANGHGFFWFYFVNEHFLRFLGKRYPRDYNKLPWALYWSLHLVWLFPWSIYLPAVIQTIKLERNTSGRESRRSSFSARSRLLCWILAGLILVFFAVSTNQEYYTFPAYLPLLILLAEGVSRCERIDCNAAEKAAPRKGWLRISAGILAAVGLAAGITLLALLWQSRHLPFEPDIGTVLASHNMDEDTLSTSHMLDLSYASFAALRLPAALAALALLIAPLLSFLLRIKRRHYAATWALAAGLAVFLVAAHIALGRFGPYLSSKDLAREIAARAHPEDKVMIYGDQAFGSSLLFYLQRPIELVNGNTTSMWFGSTFPDAPKIYLTDADLLRDWNSSGRVFLFVPAHLKSKVDSLLPNRIVVAELSGKYVYSNHP
jgi:4-amino-4-deoxy-L-arabinose transferase-like glycosyltransferase